MAIKTEREREREREREVIDAQGNSFCIAYVNITQSATNRERGLQLGGSMVPLRRIIMPK